MLAEQHFACGNSIVREYLQHVIFLSGVYADTVERIKITRRWLSQRTSHVAVVSFRV